MISTMKDGLAAVLVGAIACSGALAQEVRELAPGARPVVLPSGQRPIPMPDWTDAEIQRLGEALIGSWRASNLPVAADGGTTDVLLHVARVHVDGVPDALYAETSRADAHHRPFRECIFQVYKAKGKLRLRTYEIMRTPDQGSALTGLWAAPDAFPLLKRQDLIASLDVELEPTGDGYRGKTPYAYPTGLGGAVSMTSEMEIGRDRLKVADRGFDAEGRQVWGAEAGEGWTFVRTEPTLKAQRLDNGLVVIDFERPEAAGLDAIRPGDIVLAHYEGWLGNGFKFDSSRDRETVFQFQQGLLIEGWNRGLLGATKGTIRRLVVPAGLGYGDRRNRYIPPSSTLYFEIEVLRVERTSGDMGVSPGAPGGHDGHDHDHGANPK